MRGFFGQEFQRDGLAQRQVRGAVDFAHAAAAQQSEDAVTAAEQRAGKEAAFVLTGAVNAGDREHCAARNAIGRYGAR